MPKLTADTITAEQIRWLRTTTTDLTELRHAEVASSDYYRMMAPITWREAREHCVEILNGRVARASCPGRAHPAHARVTCNGACCTACGGPVDDNEECRCP